MLAILDNKLLKGNSFSRVTMFIQCQFYTPLSCALFFYFTSLDVSFGADLLYPSKQLKIVFRLQPFS